MESSVAPGDIIAGKYAVERVLAVGGAGVVVVAQHLQLMESCAIKLLSLEMLGTLQSRERFFQEARALAQIKSDHVVRVFDVGELDDGTPYLVMEHLEGDDLDDVLVRHRTLPIPEAAGYALQICLALAAAHRRGIVHRDLKPANVFVTEAPDGSPRLKLIDFGISKLLDPLAGLPAHLTQQGASG
jgi:serine/threonine-protein kinase